MAYNRYGTRRSYRPSRPMSRKPYRRSRATKGATAYNAVTELCYKGVSTVLMTPYSAAQQNAPQFSSNAFLFSAGFFPGFNGAGATWKEYKMTKIVYRVRTQFNMVAAAQVEEPAGGGNPIFIDPTCYVVDTLADTFNQTQNMTNDFLSYSNCDMFRGTKQSKWRTIIPTYRSFVTNNMDGVGPGVNGYININHPWLSVDNPNVTCGPAVLVGMDFVSPQYIHYDPPGIAPKMVIEAKAWFKFRNAF